MVSNAIFPFPFLYLNEKALPWASRPLPLAAATGAPARAAEANPTTTRIVAASMRSIVLDLLGPRSCALRPESRMNRFTAETPRLERRAAERDLLAGKLDDDDAVVRAILQLDERAGARLVELPLQLHHHRVAVERDRRLVTEREPERAAELGGVERLAAIDVAVPGDERPLRLVDGLEAEARVAARDRGVAEERESGLRRRQQRESDQQIPHRTIVRRSRGGGGEKRVRSCCARVADASVLRLDRDLATH